MKQIKPKIIGWEILYNDGNGEREGTVYETLDEILSFVFDPEIELFGNGKQKVRPVYEEYGDYENN